MSTRVRCKVVACGECGLKSVWGEAQETGKYLSDERIIDSVNPMYSLERLERRIEALKAKRDAETNPIVRGALDNMIIALISIFVLLQVFLALWNPAAGTGIRDIIYNLLNDSDFVATFGTGIRDAVAYFLDYVPLAAALSSIVLVLVTIRHAIKVGL